MSVNMKSLHKIVLIIVLLLLVIFSARGTLFRVMVGYESYAQRAIYPLTETELQQEVDKWVCKQDHITPEKLIHFSLSLTARKLQFVFHSTPSNPNQSVQIGKAHCVGYAAMTKAIMSRAIQQAQLQHRFEVNHHVGYIHLFGIHIHQRIDHPFWKDHDYNELIDMQTGNSIAFDPTLYDYTGIAKIRTLDFGIVT